MPRTSGLRLDHSKPIKPKMESQDTPSSISSASIKSWRPSRFLDAASQKTSFSWLLDFRTWIKAEKSLLLVMDL